MRFADPINSAGDSLMCWKVKYYGYCSWTVAVTVLFAPKTCAKKKKAENVQRSKTWTWIQTHTKSISFDSAFLFACFPSPPRLCLCLDTDENYKLFHYLVYFCYYSWALLHFLALFLGPTILFQLPFTFIYGTFNNKFSVSAK